jgi:RNA polymerase sigma-70 factor (ECF subfamily)
LPGYSLEIDQKTLRGCIKGDMKYREILYRQYFAYGMSITKRYTNNRGEAVELLNDSFMKVFENIKNYDPEKPFRVWFRLVTVNTSIDYYRKTKRMIQTELMDENLGYSDEKLTLDRLEVDDILRMIQSLPEQYALIFNLYVIDGFDHEEIADLLKIPSSTSRANLSRAKKLLRGIFEKQNYTHYVGAV